jgi:hypothetical protein
MNRDSLIVAAVVGVGIWLLWDAKRKFDAGGERVADWIAKAWMAFDDLLPGQGGIQLLGNVVFPGNVLVPVQALSNAGAIKQDRATGNVYANYSGKYWRLAPSDANGNWPATLVT